MGHPLRARRGGALGWREVSEDCSGYARPHERRGRFVDYAIADKRVVKLLDQAEELLLEIDRRIAACPRYEEPPGAKRWRSPGDRGGGGSESFARARNRRAGRCGQGAADRGDPGAAGRRRRGADGGQLADGAGVLRPSAGQAGNDPRGHHQPRDDRDGGAPWRTAPARAGRPPWVRVRVDHGPGRARGRAARRGREADGPGCAGVHPGATRRSLVFRSRARAEHGPRGALVRATQP